jgi:Ser/Thr protein kinase RdoA (MazF antagonist)
MTEKKPDIDIKRIVSFFDIPDSYKNGYPYGNGHINDTFCIETEGPRRYILQRVNSHVFRQPDKLMENIERVTRHVRGKLTEIGKDPDRYGLTLVPTKSGAMWHTDDDARIWRLYIFVEGTIAYDVVDSEAVAREGGKAFGDFQRLLSDLPGEPLFETIPDFHNMEKRLDAFSETARIDRVHRLSSVHDEVMFVENRTEDMTVLQRLGRQGKLRNRITHNDTKINNVLFDSTTLEATCVIDLDTVMPGYVLFDFGDSIRTATNTGAEDEQDLSKVSINTALFEAYTAGYLSQSASFLSDTEVAYLAESSKIMTFIIGLRFLTDYLDGDRYFRIHESDHNLIRARAQFKLVSSMEDNASLMNEIVRKLYEGVSP